MQSNRLSIPGSPPPHALRPCAGGVTGVTRPAPAGAKILPVSFPQLASPTGPKPLPPEPTPAPGAIRTLEAVFMKKFPLILVPGLLCDAQLWQPQVANLDDIADIWIAEHTRSDTMAGVARDMLADAPFASFALAGLSMGGYIALEIMRQAPQRVARLALLDTAAGADLPEQTQKRMDFIALAERGKFLGITDVLLPLLIHPSRLGESALTNVVKSMAKNVGKEAFVRQQRAIMSRADSLGLLAAIDCPALVLCGRQDALTPLARHEEIAAGIKGARLEVIENCGHLSTLEKPAEVNAALRRWLSA